MKKEIVFIWFGENEPPYAQWTIENFKKMNPGWDVVYKRYTRHQVFNEREKINDNILNIAVEKYTKAYIDRVNSNHYTGFCWLSDIYRREYVRSAKYPVVYCDVDCFPIAPFDSFFQLDQFMTAKDKVYGYNLYNANKYIPKQDNYKHNITSYYGGDGWCISNINYTKQTLTQFYKNLSFKNLS